MYGILIREGIGRGSLKNIGDYIQSIAQRQFIKGEETCLVDIERLSEFHSDKKVNLIMNGWFTWDCSKFLPPQCINPLFISFHLTPPKEAEFFTPEITAYLKQHEPIGTRDVLTMEIMKKHGIEAYMTGCLTLTLGRDYRQTTEHNGKIFIVDPYVELGGDNSLNLILRIIKSFIFLYKYYRKVCILYKKNINLGMTRVAHISKRLDKLLMVASYYAVYSKRFSDEILLEAEYSTALVDNYMSNDEKFILAEKMLHEYANARFVLTSRLHVSFPCIALHTKNIFVMPSLKTEEKDVKRYSGRLKDMGDVITVMELDCGKIINTQDNLPDIIDMSNLPEIKQGYKKYEKLLIEKIKAFMSSNK